MFIWMRNEKYNNNKFDRLKRNVKFDGKLYVNVNLNEKGTIHKT